MGLSASQGRMLLLTARKNDLEFRAQQISQRRLILSQQLEQISTDYEDATSNRQMKINLFDTTASDESGKTITAAKNLTYASLISGTLANVSSEDSGIVGVDGLTNGQQFTSNTNYRLVDAYGAIVVASEDEIPKGYNTKETKTSTSKTAAKDANGNETDLTKFLRNKNYGYENKDISYDKSQKIIKVNYKDDTDVNETKTATKYFDADTGKEITDQNKIKKFKAAEENDKFTLQVAEDDNKNPVIQISRSYENTSQGDYEVVEGSDGKFTVTDKNGNIRRYVVDPALAHGLTDANGDAGPNYLQDCLRNGKYLIQKGQKDQGDEGKFKWFATSWDSASNINDMYYNEDDDKAKARYDRLQTQIQNQDKRLELELDNIETQRSAVTTEEESVKKVIDDNVEGSFKVFNA